MPQKKPELKVYWFTHTQWQRDWESDWIQELLANDDFDVELENVRDFQTCSPNSIVVFNASLPYVQYLEQYEEKNYPFIGIHLSDEYLNNVYKAYTYKSCKAVFRNCYHPVLEQHRKVTTFALGYKVGFWDNYKGSSPETKSGRQYVWSFAGALKNEIRRKAIQMFEDIKPNFIHYETGNSYENPITGLDTETYRNIMLDSKFVVCPPGNVNLDTFRLCECLEAGAVPVALSKTGFQKYEQYYFQQLFDVVMEDKEAIPFICEDSWERCRAKMLDLIADDQLYEDTRGKVCAFWKRYKNLLSKKLCNTVKHHLLG